MKLSTAEMEELIAEFKDLINYESEDPCETIDPLTYVTPDCDTCLHIACIKRKPESCGTVTKSRSRYKSPR